ncbi:hypothetical protein SARC_15272 [Sphaeroforma arctica JP610]|uniref:GT23 domain-containing protein n=1 Tax=Sphaeroforma arctica JP610 TaxID=667725 RepID=A0A0L0F629_9EUKA|nr:hypothetical protein SARC_15272 [Sphaeroforma arctica JP610]KNC72175.1 hypothetical protein SARC_15272 [Sphaeroforma arctica JP610]|eukprot:XP_014146077.1 hypothetical protein SARC_15272 [Sphaeroforma arctica JP610]
MGVTRPVDVALYIRRSDKVNKGEKSEALLHTFREYMQHVDHLLYPDHVYHDYYDEENHKRVDIYVATDDTSIPK